jgi:DNA-binding transcriptional LysR family regulator
MSVTLRQIRCFHVVAELGSFTRAAQHLRVTQPGLSLIIRQLERALSVRLFDRTTRQVELTQAGREFLSSTQRVIHELDDSIRNAREVTDRKRGKLTVAAPPLLAATLLPQAIAEYKRIYPGIAVGIFDIQSDEVIARVKSGDVDCGVGTFATDESGLRREILLTDSLMLWCSTRSPLARKRKLTWGDLKAWPLIMLTRSSNIRSIVESAFGEIESPSQPRYEVSHMTTAIMLAEADLGVCPLPSYVGSIARRRKVVSRQLVSPTVKREVWFIHSSNRSLTPAAQAFLPVLRKQLQLALNVSQKS